MLDLPEHGRPVHTPSLATQPALSVITPCLNSICTISDTLLSVSLLAALMRQHGLRLEHLVIDGGSVDGTLQLLDCYARHHDFCRVIYGASDGPYAAMNCGLAMAKGLFTHVLNADDLIWDAQQYTALLRSGIKRKSRILLGSIVYFRRPSWRVRARWNVRPLPSETSRWFRRLRRGLHYPHPGFIAQTHCYREEGFDLCYSHSADYKLMQKLLLGIESVGQLCISEMPIVAMGEGGLTSGWRSILAGSLQLRAINQELGIHAPAWRRYFSKAFMRIPHPGHFGFRPGSHLG